MLFADISKYLTKQSKTWASALLPSDINWAMREASNCRTVTDTDSYAFFIPTIIANERKTEAMYMSIAKGKSNNQAER